MFYLTGLIAKVNNGRLDEKEKKSLLGEIIMLREAIIDSIEKDIIPISIIMWLENAEPKIVKKKVCDVYDDYVKYCDKYNIVSESKSKFSRVITLKTGHISKVITRKGYSYRIYV